jgi:hypothetical protein
MPSIASYNAVLGLDPFSVSKFQILVGIAIIIGMTIVTLLGFGVPLGFLSAIGFFIFRTQLGLFILFIFAWIAHFGEALYAFVIMTQAGVPANLKIQWTLLTFIFGFLSLGSLNKKLKILTKSMNDDNKAM